ncbi:MAG: beta-glucosidase BglX [Lewinellaceae bacterium]|nr:beta-glucosidase BglX [Lewinellaceae bacterium]
MKNATLIPILGLSLIFFLNQSLMAQQSATESKIDSLLSIMTLEEKIGQMNLYNGFWDITGPAPQQGDAKLKYEHLRKGLVGAMLNIKGVEDVRKLQELVVKESRLGIPLLFGFDVIHGQKTLAPIPLAEAASWDLQAIERSAHVAATEASALGINWAYAPMVDISRDARWGRVMEGAGEDPYLGSRIAAARVKGFQGDDLSAPNTIAATAKHFAAYGFAEAGKDYNTVDIGTSTLYNIVLPPFKAAVDSGVRTVMNSFNVLNGIPATGNAFLQRDILKDGWGFDGFVVSDWASCAEMVAHGYAANLKDAAVLAANAGSDMDMEASAYITYLKGAVEEGLADIKVIDDAVRRILRVKFELGLFDDPYRYCSPQREKELLYHPDHQAAVLDVAKRSIVLLKNEGGLLPLKKEQKKIAVIGALADDKNSPLGSWRLGSDDNTAVSVLEGLKKYTEQATYAKGADLITAPATFINEVRINETDKSGFEQAVQLAKASEVVIMVLGEHGFQSGEGRSRTQLGLPGVQQELLEAVYAANPNIVLVLMNGRPLAITWAAGHIPAILEAWQLGSQSGNAIAEALFGAYNPSGKLPMTFPRSVGQVPIYYNHYSTGRPTPQPIVFWTHYSDESNAPLFPFGYGLSYTTFKYSGLQVDASDNKNIRVKVSVKNTGPVAGEEVVQLYIRDKVASVARPVKELKGFQKINLQPNESRDVEFTLTAAELGFYDNNGRFIVEPGEFDIWAGTNSQEGLQGAFTLK